MEPLAVPIFMTITFYFAYSNLVKANTEWLKKRLRRLYIPVVGWAFIYYIVFTVFQHLFNYHLTLGLQEIFWQLTTGHPQSLNGVMWFQNNLILLTIFAFIVFKLFRHNKYAFVFLGLSTIGALFFQYSGLNYEYFSNLRFELKYPIGCFF